MVLEKKINFIRKISLSLFIFSLLSLMGSLWLQNTIAGFKFDKNIYDEKTNISKIFKKKINCSENLQQCISNIDFSFFEASKKLGNCFENQYKFYYVVDNQIFENRYHLFIDATSDDSILKTSKLKPQFINKDVEFVFKLTDKKNEKCIKNYKYYKLYKLFPYYYEFLFDLKQNSSLGAIEPINPFINGEASISNIVKRFPINIVFKSLLLISVILMYIYWRNYGYLFVEILNSRNNKFVFFGKASALFLFLHVLFLGMEIDNKAFDLMRKLVIVFFILSEIIAQFLLTTKLFKNKKNLTYYCNSYIINIKLLFIITIFAISSIVIFILLIFDLSSRVDYILEWNYFAALLFYYLLSALMWKKLTNNPTTA